MIVLFVRSRLFTRAYPRCTRADQRKSFTRTNKLIMTNYAADSSALGTSLSFQTPRDGLITSPSSLYWFKYL